MIEKNLGRVERALRLLVGLALFLFILLAELSGAYLLVLTTIAIFLLANAVTARCYLWRWLGLNSCTNDECSELP